VADDAAIAADPPEPADEDEADGDETVAEAAVMDPRSGPELEERAYEAAALASDGAADLEAAESAAGEGVDAVDAAPPAPPATPDPLAQEARWEPPAAGHQEDYDFSPFAAQDEDAARAWPAWATALIVLLLIAALAAAFWFLAPAPWKERIGIGSAGETPLQLMMTHSDRQKLASGNELLAVSGRVINPTEDMQKVPPIQAQLRSREGALVYSWTIAPPARVLPPGASATFNSAEVNVPAGGDELTITLGAVKA
jgi:hypothetical protein